jgi:hypothetical protein
MMLLSTTLGWAAGAGQVFVCAWGGGTRRGRAGKGKDEVGASEKADTHRYARVARTDSLPRS